MSGRDFNHDGKVDSRDYYLYDSICNNDSNSNTSFSSSGSSSGSVDIALIVAMFYFFTWIKGSLGTGFITGIFGLISGGYLFLRAMMWAYS